MIDRYGQTKREYPPEMCGFCGKRTYELSQHTDYRGKKRWLCSVCVESQNYDDTRCVECGRVIDWQDQVHVRQGAEWVIYCDLCAPDSHGQDLADIASVSQGRDKESILGTRGYRSDD